MLFSKKRFILLLSCLLTFPTIESQTNTEKDHSFINISVKDGLSNGLVLCIHQDRMGFMWFGTTSGLNRFDGYEFKIYKHSKDNVSSICSNIVNCIEEDNKGNLWIGTSEGLNCYDQKKDRFREFKRRQGISNDYIKSLLVDDSLLWIGTDNNLNSLNLNSGEIKYYDFCGLLDNTRIFDIHKDRKGEIWVATQEVGLIRFNPQTLEYKNYRHNKTDDSSISSDHVYIIFEDSDEELWFGTWEYGINRFDRENETFRLIQTSQDGTGINNNQIRSILENNDKSIWIGTFEGINIFNPHSGSFQYILRHNHVPGALSYNTVNCTYKDKSGAIWIGTNGGGLNLYSPSAGQFKFIDPKLQANHDFGFIGPLIEHNGEIWIGTEGGGLANYNPKNDKYNYFDLDLENTMKSNTIKALYLDKNDKLWIGTYAGGILTFDINKKIFDNYFDNRKGIENNIVHDIIEDHNGNIIVGSNSVHGIHVKEKNSDHFVAGLASKTNSERVDLPWIRAICNISEDVICFGSIYYGIYLYDKNKGLEHISTDKSNINSDYINFITKDSSGKIWIGTNGEGINVYEPVTGQIKRINISDGLLDNNICSIIEDEQRNIWISSVAGITRYNINDSTFTNFSYSNSEFPIEILNIKSGLLASDGQIYFGGSNGFVRFNPQNITNNTYIPPVFITNLRINNQEVTVGDKTGILPESISTVQKIDLKYNQSNIAIEFSALNYIYSENNQYQYILEGYDIEWSKPGFQRQGIYTNLPTGRYTFRIKASNNSGIWNNTETSLKINILPPIWKTCWAYILYFIFFSLVVLFIINYFISRMRLRNSIRMEQLEKRTMEEAHQSKMNMFTNFSHELRTPLTLIINPIKNIISDVLLPSEYRESLQLVYKNANKILLLVNQLLDLRKQEVDKIKIRVEENDIVKFSKEIALIFNDFASSRNINLEFHSVEKKVITYFDPFLLEKVFYNILSNAIKNTYVQGEISIILNKSKQNELSKYRKINNLPYSEDYIVIEISDTGKGIAEKDLDKIFNPFFQIDESDNTIMYSTGLGLYITKSFVELHHGVIVAENRKEGGMCFVIILPMDKSFFSADDLNLKDESNFASSYKSDFTNIGKVSSVNNDKLSSGEKERLENLQIKENLSEKITDKENVLLSNYKEKDSIPIVLIVEDNSDIRLYLKKILDTEYVVYEAENGEVAWNLAKETIPDIIISDIMMPVMDGLVLCKLVKSNIGTCHIPVILLTARTSIMQIEGGLLSGADDYITKPFDSKLLTVKMKNILENRKKIKDAYLKNFYIDLPEPLSNQLDDRFLKRAYDYVKENISNSELSIESFGKEMYLSRTQLYRKIKALTGLTPTNFVSTLRLKHASELLIETSLSVSEISFQVGFSNPSYFTTSFKKHFNLTPSEYILRYKK
jgi:signal transduction histidine kinase/ligand-binding sensor domain-containing protein/DNA-binding response OmpR family regulator